MYYSVIYHYLFIHYPIVGHCSEHRNTMPLLCKRNKHALAYRSLGVIHFVNVKRTFVPPISVPLEKFQQSAHLLQ